MIDVFYCELKAENKPVLSSLLKQMPEKLKNEILRYKFERNRYEHALGKLLLLKALKHYGYSSDCLECLKYTEYSRPYIDENVDFNISHSGSVVVCCISKNRVLGVDVEEVREIEFDNFTNVMSQSQWNEIFSMSDPRKLFFNMWTQKESVVKAIGLGLSLPLEEIYIENDMATLYDETYYLKNLQLHESYAANIASDKGIGEVNYHDIVF